MNIKQNNFSVSDCYQIIDTVTQYALVIHHVQINYSSTEESSGDAALNHTHVFLVL